MTDHTSQNTGPFKSQINEQLEESDEASRHKERGIYIAVMGMTGAGKSTFISHCTDTKVAISDPGVLQSCTQEVQVYRCKNSEAHMNVYLVDTPGFDDTTRKDTDILKEIAFWLTTTYKKNIRLSGILYLHRISDNRMGGCAHRNLAMFKKLCGPPDGIKNVIFLTTFWEKVDPTEGDTRENNLQSIDEFWGFFVKRGARVQRHLNNENSAMATIQNFIPSDITKPPEEIKLAIQTEMVDSGKDLDQTSAGQELQSELQKEREKMQQEFNDRAREIQDEKDQEMRDILREDQERQAKELQRRDSEIQDLKISMERMHEKKLQELEERMLKQIIEYDRHRVEMDREMRQREHQHREEIEEIAGQREKDFDNLKRTLRDMHNTIQHQQMQLDQFNQDPSEGEEYDSEGEYDSSDHDSTHCRAGSVNGKVTPTTSNKNDGYHDMDPNLTCLSCKTKFSDRHELFAHIEAFQHGRDLVTGKPETYTRPVGDEKPTLWRTCQVCWEDFNDKEDLFQHMKQSRHGVIVQGKPVYLQRPKRSKWYKPDFISRWRK